jgi:hypothetical protein
LKYISEFPDCKRGFFLFESSLRKLRASRRYAEARYDVHKVNAVMLREMRLSPDV